MRGSVDGLDFKSYIPGILFYRYISENITNYINRGEWESGNTGFDYADLKDTGRRADGGVTTPRNNTPLPSAVKIHG